MTPYTEHASTSEPRSGRRVARRLVGFLGGLACAVGAMAIVELFGAPRGALHRPDLLVHVGFVVLGALLVFGVGVHTRLGTRLDLASPLVYFAVPFTFNFLARPLAIWHVDELSLKAVEFFSRAQAASYYLKAIGALVLFLGLVFAGHLLVKRLLEEAGSDETGGPRNVIDEVCSDDVQKLRRLVLFFLTVGAVGVGIIVTSNPAVLTGTVDRNLYVQTPLGRMGYGLLLFVTPVPALAYLYALEKRRLSECVSIRAIAFAICTVVIAMWLGSVHGSRGLLIGMLVSLVVAHSVRHRRVGAKGTVVLFLGVVGFLLAWDAWEASESRVNTLSGAAITLVATGGSSFDNIVEVIRSTSWGIKHDYGYHFLGVVFDFLPADLRPISGSERFTEVFFPDVFRQGIGRAGPMISEFYWSFGIAGVAGLGLITGGLFGVVDRWRKQLVDHRTHRQALWGTALYAILFTNLAGFAFGSFTKWVPTMAVNLVILTPILYAYSQSARRSNEDLEVSDVGGMG